MAVRARALRARAETRGLLAAYLAENSCVDCGEDDIRVLDFDHRPGVVKVAEVARMAMHGMSWRAIEAEIAKCDVRCANCHRRRTSERGSWWKQPVFEERAGARSREAMKRLVALFPVVAS